MRDIRHEEGHELDEKFQCDMDDTRDDSSRGRGAIRGVMDDKEAHVEEVGGS